MTEPTSPQAPCDLNLLFGILALQMDFLSRDALIKGMNAWVLEKHKPLGQVLREQGALRDDIHALVEAMVQKHLELHEGDSHKVLSAVSFVGPCRRDLEQLADPDLDASLGYVPSTTTVVHDPNATGAFMAGTPTS